MRCFGRPLLPSRLPSHLLLCSVLGLSGCGASSSNRTELADGQAASGQDGAVDQPGNPDAANHHGGDASNQEPPEDGSVAAPDANHGAADGATPPGATGQWVMGYYVSYQLDRYPIADIDWSALTHIFFAPLVVRDNGSIATNFVAFGSDAEGANVAKQLSAAAHAHGVKALLMLGGAGLSASVKPAMDADLNGFVQRLLATMNELGYDGIDLDVEAGNFDLDDYVTLAAALRAAAPNIILTVPGATITYGQAVDPRLVQLATYLDRYNMQSYQGGSTGMFTGGNSAGERFESWFYGALGGIGPLRPYAIDYALAQLAAAGIPKSKLGMGVAFYAGCYRTPDTTPAGGQDVSAPRMPTNAPSDWCWDCGIGGGDNVSSYNYFYAQGTIFANSTASERKRDDVAKEPYLSFASPKSSPLCGGSTRYVVYEDEVSLIEKGKFSQREGYGGVILWTLQQGWLPANAAGGRARNALMQALREGFLVPQN